MIYDLPHLRWGYMQYHGILDGIITAHNCINDNDICKGERSVASHCKQHLIANRNGFVKGSSRMPQKI